MVDIDGSHLYKKQQKLLSLIGKLTALPKQPFIGWDSINTANHKDMASKLPRVTHGEFDS